MEVRPALKVGDIVKLSKKGKRFSRKFAPDATMVVSRVKGDGVDRSSVIVCRLLVDGEFEHRSFYRSELWSTGKNAFNK